MVMEFQRASIAAHKAEYIAVDISVIAFVRRTNSKTEGGGGAHQYCSLEQLNHVGSHSRRLNQA
jgi:hypothetical protein